MWLHFKPKLVGIDRETGKMKIIIPFGSNPTRNRKFIKNGKKISKIRKRRLWLLFKQKLVEMAEKETKIQIIVSFRSYPVRNRKFQTNSKKIQKIIKKQLGLLFKQKLVGNGRERDKNTNYRFVSFQPNA